ncbi:MAG: ABC transporter ATP-binding protein [Proteobacteria bacterium]|nr:ABC transporter ATP-binding protein [Pseudomonadota bacterium]MBI3496149.1 ABC transporter ATP-binding protein [Pseudomonadota bacterium]
MPDVSAPILAVEGLTTRFETQNGVFDAVADLSYSLGRGETLAIVGESGCGKSVQALSVLRLLPSPPARIVAGSIRFGGSDLAQADEPAMRRLRGNRISMIFQEPMTSLNPSMTVGRQIAEALELHRGLSTAAAAARTEELLALVRIAEPARRAREYPHRLSGGMRQRVMIAMALACEPDVLIADEPTTALDVTIQAQILELLRDLQARLGSAVVLITHDLGVVAETADRIVVMYAGRKVEEAPVEALFGRPRHPYTRGLLASVPRLDAAPGPRLVEIAGAVPAPWELPAGCAFAPRCPLADAHCRAERPPLTAKAAGHLAACWHSDRL